MTWPKAWLLELYALHETLLSKVKYSCATQ